MCGIVGIALLEGTLPAADARRSALDNLARRGPNGQGEWADGGVWLGHRRLAVLDPSLAGSQPMVSASGRFVTIFNGEIYNHLEIRQEFSLNWRGTSDTETLVESYARWGEACLDKLIGMFAFAVWDRVERRLFLARDRLGVKPLYYTTELPGIAFASRPGALEALLGSRVGDLDADAVRAYLELGYIPAPLTMHRDMRKLEAGTCLLWQPGKRRLRRYWDFAQIEIDDALRSADEREIVEETASRIRSAVQRRLISDVPIGAFLSAGVDSSLVVAAMKSAGVERPRTFTIGFRERSHDESVEAARIAAHLGTEHTSEQLGVDDLLALLPDFLRDYDEPFADSSAFPTMAVSRLAQRSVVVALSGDGGDELFGGYHYYRQVQRLAPLLSWTGMRRAALQRGAGLLPGHRASLVAAALAQHSDVALHHFARSVSKDFPPLLHPDLQQHSTSSLEYFEQAAASFAMDLEPAEKGMRLDLRFMLADGYLQKVDVASMSRSLEVRCPLTDHTLVEWAMRLPLHFKLRGRSGKHVLRRALATHLPPQVSQRPKTGFGVPMAQWLRGPLRDWALELIHDESILARVPLDKNALRSLLQTHLDGRRDAHPLLWAVLVLLARTGNESRTAATVATLQRAA